MSLKRVLVVVLALGLSNAGGAHTRPSSELADAATTDRQELARTPSASQIEFGKPIAKATLKAWKSQDVDMSETPPSGKNIDALQAAQQAYRNFAVSPHAFISAVRYARMTNPVYQQPKSSGYVWVVMFGNDYPAVTVCPKHGCSPAPSATSSSRQSNVVVDARTDRALFKFYTAHYAP